MADRLDLREQRDAIDGADRGVAPLIDVDQLQRAHIAVFTRMRARDDTRTAFASADLKPRSILRKGIERRAIRVLEVDGHEKLRDTGRFVVHISNALQIELIPVMRAFLRGVPLIFIFDPIAASVLRSRQTPFEDPGAICRIRYGRGIGSEGIQGAVETLQPTRGADFPVAVGSVAVMEDLREKPLGTRPVAREAHAHFDRDQIFRARKEEDVLRVVIARNSLRRFAGDARNTQTPAQTERAVTSSRAV